MTRAAQITRTGRRIALQVRRTHRPVDWPRKAPCPAHVDGPCQGHFARDGEGGCRTWICRGCGFARPWCFGADGAFPSLCDDCAAERMPDTRDVDDPFDRESAA